MDIMLSFLYTVFWFFFFAYLFAFETSGLEPYRPGGSLNSRQTCPCLPSAGNKDVRHHARLRVLLLTQGHQMQNKDFHNLKCPLKQHKTTQQQQQHSIKDIPAHSMQHRLGTVSLHRLWLSNA